MVLYACVLLDCHQMLPETDVTNSLPTEKTKGQSEVADWSPRIPA